MYYLFPKNFVDSPRLPRLFSSHPGSVVVASCWRPGLIHQWQAQ